jgi:hypothetical protein
MWWEMTSELTLQESSTGFVEETESRLMIVTRIGR